MTYNKVVEILKKNHINNLNVEKGATGYYVIKVPRDNASDTALTIINMENSLVIVCTIRSPNYKQAILEIKEESDVEVTATVPVTYTFSPYTRQYKSEGELAHPGDLT